MFTWVGVNLTYLWYKVSSNTSESGYVKYYAIFIFNQFIFIHFLNLIFMKKIILFVVFITFSLINVFSINIDKSLYGVQSKTVGVEHSDVKDLGVCRIIVNDAKRTYVVKQGDKVILQGTITSTINLKNEDALMIFTDSSWTIKYTFYDGAVTFWNTSEGKFMHFTKEKFW